jgi:hypothetical protein
VKRAGRALLKSQPLGRPESSHSGKAACVPIWFRFDLSSSVCQQITLHHGKVAFDPAFAGWEAPAALQCRTDPFHSSSVTILQYTLKCSSQNKSRAPESIFTSIVAS